MIGLSWEIKTGNARKSIRRKSPVQLVDMSQDSAIVLSADEEGWIEAWSVENGDRLSALNTHRQIGQLVVGVDGNRILAKLENTPQLPIICLHNTPAHPIGSQQLAANQYPGSAKQRIHSTKSQSRMQPSTSYADASR